MEARQPGKLPTCLLEVLESAGITQVSSRPLDVPSTEKFVYKAVLQSGEPAVVLYSRRRGDTWKWKFDKEREVLRALANGDQEHEGRAHVLKMYNDFDADGWARGPSMVMEAVQPVGWDLLRLLTLYIQKYIQMPISEMQQYFTDSAKGVSYLHFKGYVHCDLKADQILISGRPDYSAKVVDFGFATAMGHNIAYRRLSEYLAPEFDKGVKATAAMDVFGIGGILYQMWVHENLPDPNHSYFQKHWLDEVHHFDAKGVPKETQFDKTMRDTLRKLLARDPSKRWSLATILGPEHGRPKFLTISTLEYQRSERESVRDEVGTAKSMQLCRIKIRSHIDCCVIQVDGEMSGKTLLELELGAVHHLLVLLIQRGSTFITVPKAHTRLEVDDWLYIAGWLVDELSVKERLCGVASMQLQNVPLKTFYPEFDQFDFPPNCYGAVVGPAKFAKAGQKAMNLRDEFNINLVAIQRSGQLITAGDIRPETEIEEGDIGVVCRRPLPNGFSTSIVTDAMLTRLAKDPLMVGSAVVDEKPSAPTTSPSTLRSIPSAFSWAMSHIGGSPSSNDMVQIRQELEVLSVVNNPTPPPRTGCAPIFRKASVFFGAGLIFLFTVEHFPTRPSRTMGHFHFRPALAFLGAGAGLGLLFIKFIMRKHAEESEALRRQNEELRRQIEELRLARHEPDG